MFLKAQLVIKPETKEQKGVSLFDSRHPIECLFSGAVSFFWNAFGFMSSTVKWDRFKFAELEPSDITKLWPPRAREVVPVPFQRLHLIYSWRVNNSGWRTVCVSEVTCYQDLEGLKRSERCPQGVSGTVGHHLFWRSVCMCCLIKGTVAVSLNLLHGVFFVVGRSTCFIKTYVFLLFFSIFLLLWILL